MKGAPGIVWEAGIDDEIEAGAKVTFLALGPEDTSLDSVEGWYVVLEMPDGTMKLLVKQKVFGPRLFKTYPGISAFAKDHCKDWASITLPLVPTVRSEKEVWEFIENSGNSRPTVPTKKRKF